MSEIDEKNPGKKFNYIFNRFDRPIVGIRVNEERVKILGHDFFVQSEFRNSNNRFLETNSINQNSPLHMTLTMSFVILPSLWLIIRQKIMLMVQQNINNQLDQEIGKLRTTLQKIETLAQQNNIVLNQPSQISELQHTVTQKGGNVLDEMEVHVS